MKTSAAAGLSLVSELEVDMSRPKVARLDLANGVALEYLKSRGALRLLCGNGSVEVPLVDVLGQLGIRAADVVPAGQYLLFAGDAAPSGGIADLVAVYASEEEAREAFCRLRLLPAAQHAWAQLVAVRANGRIEYLCWFGRQPSGGQEPPVQPAEPVATVRRGMIRRRLRGTVRVLGDEPPSPEPLRPAPDRLPVAGPLPVPGPPPTTGNGREPDGLSAMAAMLSVSLAAASPFSAPGTAALRRRR